VHFLPRASQLQAWLLKPGSWCPLVLAFYSILGLQLGLGFQFPFQPQTETIIESNYIIILTTKIYIPNVGSTGTEKKSY
jgi:hypothetical protein